MTAPTSPGGRAGRVVVWTAGLAVALGSAVATAHGLFEVALAARVPGPIAWLYPLITDGLALVAYLATARLSGPAARYAWSVVVLAAGLSGLAQAAYLAADPTTAVAAPTMLRFGVGAWPAIAAAIAAHLLHLLLADPNDPAPDRRGAVPPAVPSRGPVLSARPLVPPARPTALDATRGQTAVPPPVPSLPVPAPAPGTRKPTASAGESTARSTARVAALRYAARHGALPTVNALAEAARVSRGTAAAVLKPLRDQPLPLHLITSSADEATENDQHPTEEHTQP